ncbi:hypothetical protein G6L94_19940 [Agrobacterium rhizogenes]|uniref:Uncharacterized protein n=1 Tax=Rhizobium rhizogenes NBRC 13257 TaxID=1220581 RepID=A0AA87PYC5_RHIRH|nr:isoaspartyl peptidase/L-asparaginase [Rhizobium rhizogenes]KAA6486149.1 hypothetical protein DXT98_17345 [Agrobacterium sp. ICMP 7243]OCI93424.1 hypothetical protein A6U85_19660 [Agrobacterium sp. 13-626]OCJ20602.1 hypothetical protein A6U89_12380 [Agrobacterium sp. B133/95]KEA03622.1 hypothetical protein CN09_31610 [Rhizobium rhizogenes]MDJ1634080.1 isoaspartyl peptidase/L-asparaginase [Rhizobium rhizogenes]
MTQIAWPGRSAFFIRYVVGHEIASRLAYLKQDLASAADGVVNGDLAPYHIGAKLVAIDAAGEVVATHETIYEVTL